MRPSRTRTASITSALVAGLVAASPARAELDVSELSLEELLEVPVTTASNVGEKLSEAPATVLIVTRAEIEDRGYRQLGDLLDDLPGMDVVRPYGDSWMLSYWRGYRSDQTAPYLLMIDGLVVNSLYTADVEGPIQAMPLTSIDRIEIVFGPASSVYGPNAFMGVVNVITRSDAAADGVERRARLAVGSDGERIADASVFYKRGALRFSLATRFERGRLDDSSHERYEYTRSTYYQDRRLWGGFLDNPNLGGRFNSEHEAIAVDGRVFVDRTELGVQFLQFASGYGLQYAADLVQNDAVWKRRSLGVYLRHAVEVTDDVDSRTTLYYREGGIPNDTYYVDGYQDEVAGRVAAMSYWQSRNRSWSVLQDFTIAPRPWPWLTVTSGLSYERKDLQKAYEVNGEGPAGTPGGYEPVDTIAADTYAYPEPPPAVDHAENRIATEDAGAYVQVRTRVAPRHLIFVGGRVDGKSGYEATPTVRAGYVGSVAGVGLKALYGQAYKEPSPRTLYGGWTGAGSDPDLRPERSQTFQVSAAYTLPWVTQSLDAYLVDHDDTIFTGAVARNLGRRTLIAVDYAARAQLALPADTGLEVWGYYTRLLHTREDVFDEATQTTSRHAIGDLATNKVHMIATARQGRHLALTLRGRFIGRRPTVATNPVGVVGRFATADAHLRYRDLGGTGLGLSLGVDNVTDSRYFHPGVNEASAGTTPGSFAADGTWTGSGGYFSSLLPQPGRSFLVSLWLER